MENQRMGARIVSFLTTGLLALSGVACSGVPADRSEDVAESSSALTGTAYAIRTYTLGGLCMDTATSNNAVALRDCKFTNNASQKWGFPPKGPGFYVESYSAPKVLAIYNESSSGFPVKVEFIGTSQNVDQELWQIPGINGVPTFATFKLANEYDNRCMTATAIGSNYQVTEEACVNTGFTNDRQTFMLDTF